jgi:peptide/nickel transport system substrate-binding protein
MEVLFMKFPNQSLTRRGLRPGAFALLAMCLSVLLAAAPAAYAQAPKHGGTLVFTIPASDAPSMDGHQETTFAVVHAVAPMYSLLIRIDPNDLQARKYVGDVAQSWTVSADKKTYTFKLRPNVLFSDGSKLTAKDVVASFMHQISPPDGTISPRKAYFSMIESVTAPNDTTVVFQLKFPSGAFLGVAANPFNWIYKADILAKDPNWYKTNVLGSGPFILKEQNPGANWVGVRNPKYFQKGLPYLDGYEGIYTPKEVVEIQAMRSGRSMIQFRGFPPAARDQLKQEMGDNIRVQESAWNCGLFAVPNTFKKPFDDVRVRQALNMSLDRWGGSEYLSKIAIVKKVGGFVFPGHELAMTDDELARDMPGYGRDIEGQRKKARQLLKDAGVPEGFKFKLTNRSTDQPYKPVGTWIIDQWRQIGLTVEQVVLPTGPFFANLRQNPPQYDVTMDFNCQTIVNPQVDVSQFQSGDKSDANSGHYTDRKLDDLYDAQLREPDLAKQKALLKEYQIYLATQSYYINTLWWNRLVMSNVKVQGWNVSPSHYINNQLDTVWLQQ